MSRYVDLNGLTWDGNPISSKIQEVKTKNGYMQGITVGWLWGDNVPHLDLEEHDAKVMANAIEEFSENLIEQIQKMRTWYEERPEEIDYVQICVVFEDFDKLIDMLKQLKENK